MHFYDYSRIYRRVVRCPFSMSLVLRTEPSKFNKSRIRWCLSQPISSWCFDLNFYEKTCVVCFLCKIASETPIGTKRKTFRSRLKEEQNGIAIWRSGSCIWRGSFVATNCCAVYFLRKISSETPIGTKRKTFWSRLEAKQYGVALWRPGSCIWRPGSYIWRSRSCVATKSCVACFLSKISSETQIGTKRKTVQSRPKTGGPGRDHAGRHMASRACIRPVAIWRPELAWSRSPYGDPGLYQAGHHMVSRACIRPVPIWRPGLTLSRLPYGDLGLHQAGRHMETRACIRPVAIWQHGLTSSRSPYGDLVW